MDSLCEQSTFSEAERAIIGQPSRLTGFPRHPVAINASFLVTMAWDLNLGQPPFAEQDLLWFQRAKGDSVKTTSRDQTTWVREGLYRWVKQASEG